MEKLSQSSKQKRKQVKQACTNCRKKHIACDDSRPCLQCVKHGLKESCRDEPRKRSRKNSMEEGGGAPLETTRYSPPISNAPIVSGYGEIYQQVPTTMHPVFMRNPYSMPTGTPNMGPPYPMYLMTPNNFIGDNEVQVLLRKHSTLNQQLLNICYPNNEVGDNLNLNHPSLEHEIIESGGIMKDEEEEEGKLEEESNILEAHPNELDTTNERFESGDGESVHEELIEKINSNEETKTELSMENMDSMTIDKNEIKSKKR